MKDIKQVIIAPDSFKGTMEAAQVCRIIQASVRNYFPAAAVRCIPMADGGEGMVDAYLELLGGRKVFLTVQGLQGRLVACHYGILPDGTAVMEMAACAGLPLLDGALDPMHTTTYGVGEMLLHAERNGIRRVLLGIGGSATVDCGLGMAAALGYRFLDKNGAQVEAITCHMADIASIIVPDRKPKLDIIAACDVDNPLCGETGAIYTFGKQKGISEEMMPQMDAQVKRFARIIAKQTGVNVLDVPGAGAAGGMGAALLAFLNAKLKPGVELLLDAVGFDSLLKETDIVFTGEGRIDWQSIRGKVPVGVARRAQAAGVPCIALCGSVGEGAEQVFQKGVTAIFSAIGEACDFSQVKKNCIRDLKLLSDSVMRLLAAGSVQTLQAGVPLVLDKKYANGDFRGRWTKQTGLEHAQTAGISALDREITTERKEAR